MAERYHLNHPFLLSQSGVTNGHWISFERFRRFSVHVLGMLAGDIVKAFGSNEPTQPAATGGIVLASITADSLIDSDTPLKWLRVAVTDATGGGDYFRLHGSNRVRRKKCR